MIVQTLFHHEGQLKVGEVEVKLLPGVPNLHIVGLPDASIRECGIRLKSALKSCDLAWPQGHQIVVNLRPPHFRKSGAGVDLAVALGFLAETGQLPDAVIAKLADCIVYGELALDGRVFGPHDLSYALRSSPLTILSGEPTGTVRDGEWWQLTTLNQQEPVKVSRQFDWPAFWRKPEFPDLELHSTAADALVLSAHMHLNVLLAGPQGSGKSTWAKALYALTTEPSAEAMSQVMDLFGEEVLETGWRPFERPHHSITPLAMIGGGNTIFPGVISRAHGGMLVMDEFLEFDGEVLEALREPIENGYIEIARRGERMRYPADFQLIGTTNLCPCGKLNPDPQKIKECSRSLTWCRSVCARLSGPVLDRFDVLVLSHEWMGPGPKMRFTEIREEVEACREFAKGRRDVKTLIPQWASEVLLSHRRRNSLLRVARGLADRDRSREITDQHFQRAFDYVESPMGLISQLFA